MPYLRKPQEGERGVIALMTIIVIGALIMVVGISASFIGQTEIVLSGDVDSEHAARMVASACVEEAIYRLKLDESYAGGTVPIGSATCTVTVSGSGTTRTVTASATVSSHTKTLNVGALRKQNVAGNARGWTVDSWAEGNPL